MLFDIAVFNVFTSVFDCANCVFRVLHYVRQNITVLFALTFHYSLQIMFFALTILFCTYTLCRILMTSLFAEFIRGKNVHNLLLAPDHSGRSP